LSETSERYIALSPRSISGARGGAGATPPVGSDNIVSVDLLHPCRQKKPFQPADSIAPLGAVSEDRPLPRSSKRDSQDQSIRGQGLEALNVPDRTLTLSPGPQGENTAAMLRC